MDIDKMTPEEINVAVAAEVMEWEPVNTKNRKIWIHPDKNTRTAPEDWSTNIAAAYAMEDRIEELNLAHQYIINLVMIVCDYEHITDVVIRIGRGLSADQLFAVIHATPEDRCRAALKAAEAPAGAGSKQ